jgi:hypothetical protein
MVDFKSTIGNSVKVLILLNVDSSSLVHAVLKEEIACLGCSFFFLLISCLGCSLQITKIGC